MAGLGALAALGTGEVHASPGTAVTPPSRTKVSAWVWQFDADGTPIAIREEAARRGLRVIVKSHDGLDWMAKWDTSPDAVTGREQLQRLHRFFADYHVPMDAWCVPTGVNPDAEAEMCAQVLDAGVEKLYLDLEKGAAGSFWCGTGADAMRFGHELRKRHPNANLILAPDARPWRLEGLPVHEFAVFASEIAPQSYWKLFDTEANLEHIRRWGYEPGPDGFTPELMLDVTRDTFSQYNRTISPIGDGEAGAEDWVRFMRRASEHGMNTISVWRFGLPQADVWDSIAAPPQDDMSKVVRVARRFFDRWHWSPTTRP
jgi:hypothetical protein